MLSLPWWHTGELFLTVELPWGSGHNPITVPSGYRRAEGEPCCVEEKRLLSLYTKKAPWRSSHPDQTPSTSFLKLN